MVAVTRHPRTRRRAPPRAGALGHGPVCGAGAGARRVVVGWDVATRVLDASARVLPSPGLVARSTLDDRADLWPAIWTTTKEAVLGILVAIVVAVALAMVVDWSLACAAPLYPLIVGSQTLPIIALAPLVVIWFGFGTTPKVVLVALFTFFSIAVGLLQGLASVEHQTMSFRRTMGASGVSCCWHARLPSAVPQFFTGLRIAVTYAYVAAIVAEFVGAQQGLGVDMTTNKNAFRTDLVFGAVLVTAGADAAAVRRGRRARAPSMPWRRPADVETGW